MAKKMGKLTWFFIKNPQRNNSSKKPRKNPWKSKQMKNRYAGQPDTDKIDRKSLLIGFE